MNNDVSFIILELSMLRFILLISIILLSGCYNLGDYRKSHTRSTSLVEFLYPDRALPLKDKQNPVLNLPLHIGLVFIPDRSSATVISPITKNRLLEGVKKSFEDKEYIANITIIPELYIRNNQGYPILKQIKTLYQLDVIALVSYDQLLNSQENILGLTYLTIVGAFIFHGTEYNVNTLMDLAVVDIDSQSILFRAAGTSTSKNKRVSYAKHKKAFSDVQNQEFEIAMTEMQNNLILELDKFETRIRNRDENEIIKVNYRKGYSGGSASWSFIIFLMLLVFLKKYANTLFKK